MSSWETRSLHLGDTTVVYDTSAGVEPTLLFIPGWACPRTQWREVLDRLPDRHRAIVIDLPNQGDSRSDSADGTIRTSVELILRVIEAEGSTRVVPIAHSMGGAIAVELAVVAPDLIDRIVCVDSLTYDTIYPAQDDDVIAAVLADLKADYPSAVVGIVTALFIDPVHAALADAVAESMASQPALPAIDAMRGLLAWDRDAALAQTSVHIDILSAEPLLSPDARAQLPDSVTITPIHGGHFLHMERPAETAAWVAERIEGVSA